MRRIVLVWLIAALIPLLGCEKKEGTSTIGASMKGRKFPVIVEEAQVRDVAYRIESVGTLEAEEDVRVPARVDGAVSKVNFEEGDQVTSDRVLVEIDPERYQLEVARARANVEKARAEVKDAEQAYEQRADLRRQEEGWVSQEELRKLQTAVDAARAEVNSAEVDVNLALKKLNDSRVKAPFRGVIYAKSISTGEYVKAETIVATIARVERLKLRFNIAEVDAGRLAVGQELEFTVRALPGKIFRGKVFFISTVADPDTRMVEVKAYVPNPDLQLRPGNFASVILETSVHKNAVLVPEEAVIPTEEGFVCFVARDQVASRKGIEIGQRSGGQVEILKGIDPGDLVVVRGGHSLTDGMPIEIKKNKK